MSLKVQTYDYSPIYIKVPSYLKNNFDKIIKFKRLSKTHILNQMIQNFIIEEQNNIKNDNKLDELLSSVKSHTVEKTLKQKQKLEQQKQQQQRSWVDNLTEKSPYSWEESY